MPLDVMSQTLWKFLYIVPICLDVSQHPLLKSQKTIWLLINARNRVFFGSRMHASSFLCWRRIVQTGSTDLTGFSSYALSISDHMNVTTSDFLMSKTNSGHGLPDPMTRLEFSVLNANCNQIYMIWNCQRVDTASSEYCTTRLNIRLLHKTTRSVHSSP